MTYQVKYCIPYEGDYVEEFETLDGIKDFIRSKCGGYMSYDDFDIIEIARFVDVYDLMAEEE